MLYTGTVGNILQCCILFESLHLKQKLPMKLSIKSILYIQFYIQTVIYIMFCTSGSVKKGSGVSCMVAPNCSLFIQSSSWRSHFHNFWGHLSVRICHICPYNFNFLDSVVSNMSTSTFALALISSFLILTKLVTPQ